MEGDIYKSEELAWRAENVTIYEEAILVANEYETIIRSKKKSALNVVLRQGIIFKNFERVQKNYGDDKGT